MLVQDITCKPFSTFQSFTNPSYEDILGSIDPTVLDDRFNRLYANRTLFTSMVTNNALDETGLLGIWLSHSDKWKSYRTALGLEYDPLDTYHSTETRNRSYETNGTNSSTHNGNDSVYGFDSTDAVNDSANTETSNGENKRNDTTTETVTLTGNRTGTAQSDLLVKELRLRRISYIDTIMADVRDELTLAIYE